MCDAIYWEKVPKAKQWFSSKLVKDVTTVVRLQQVLAADLRSFEPISKDNPIKGSLSKKGKTEAVTYAAQRLGDDEHEEILDEISRRDLLEYDEVESDEESEESDSDSSEEGEEAE